VSGRLVAVVIVGVLLVVLAAQNSDLARIRLLLWEVDTPLYALVVISALSGAVIAVASGGIWRHRRQIRTDEHRELLQFRQRRTGRPRTGAR
jgi:uncharacterized integral membrane protein